MNPRKKFWSAIKSMTRLIKGRTPYEILVDDLKAGRFGIHRELLALWGKSLTKL